MTPWRSKVFVALLAQIACALLAAPVGGDPTTSPTTYKLVWSDEFDKPGKPDPAKWGYESGFVRNNEPQLYTDHPENVRVEDGCLVIEARHEHVANPKFNATSHGRNKQPFAEYTSACVTTRGRVDWLYGRIEVRAQLPNAKGDWPAIWMLGTRKSSDDRAPHWPLCGETDIMELWGAADPHIVQAHLIYQSKGKYKSEGKSLRIDDPTAFHIYTADWTPDQIDFLVDGKLYESIKTDKAEGDAFHRPQFLLLNLALEPNETRIDPAIFPQQMKVDYVRIYQRQ